MTSVAQPVAQMGTQQPHQTIVQQQLPTVIVQPSPSGNTSSSWKGLTFTGYAQVILGVVSVLFGILGIVFRAYLYQAGHPLWGGICFYIVAGLLGIAAGRKQDRGLVVGYLVMSIIASVVAGSVIVMSGIGMSADVYVCPDWHHNPYGFDYDYFRNNGCSSSKGTRLAIDALILMTGLAELIIAIIGAAFTCGNLCCRTNNSRSVVRYSAAPHTIVAGQPHGVVQYVFATPQQQFVQQPGNVMYAGQPQLQYQGQVQYQPNPQAPSQYQPNPQAPGQYQINPQAPGQYQPNPQAPGQNQQPYLQGQVQPTMQAQGQGQVEATASFNNDNTPSSAPPKGYNLPEDHHKKPLIT